MFVVGVDGGATKTAAVVLDRQGQLLGRGYSDSSNYHNVGLEQTRAHLLEAMEAAAYEASVSLPDAAAIVWALAGVDRPAERHLFADLGQALLPSVPLRVENDTVAALMGGLGHRQGIVLIAGTGMNVYGENQGRTARAGGWGYFLDHGSGYDLAQEALRAVSLAADGRTPSTLLTTAILEALNLQQPTDLIGWVYSQERTLSEVAALAPLVLEAAEEGDVAALEIVARGASALATAVDAVARQLERWSQPFPLVMAGGLMRHSPFYREVVCQAIRTRVPGACPGLPLADAAVGAALLALETLGASGKWQVANEADLQPVTCDLPPITEQRNVLTRDMDRHATETLVGLMHLQDQRAVEAVGRVLPALSVAVDAIAERMRQGGRLIYVGAGTSGRLGVLDATECGPTFNTEPGQVIGLIAGGEEAITNSLEGAEDSREEGCRAIRALNVGPLDNVIGIAASGRTPYTLGALEEARARGALTVGISCNLPAPISELADLLIAPLVGPEALTGSTRLGAGTAQKLVLNVISTAVMTRLGKTYGNLMVDVRPQNSKLQARARRILRWVARDAGAAGMDEATAGAILEKSGGDLKRAIVSLLGEVTPDEAGDRLAKAGGNVRQAIINDE